MLSGKCVILGVSGSIAAYKAASLASLLKKQNCDVHVIMTENGSKFVSPMTFETLTGNKCIVDTFDRDFKHEVTHVSLAKKADLIIVAPATANVIAKFACGIADDMLTTTVLASKAVKIVSPAMNTNMYENPVTQENLAKLKSLGFNIVEPATGLLACGDVGSGKMPEPEVLMEHVLYHLSPKKDLAGKKVIVTAGPTQEAIDPVRFISNHSTGKMGYALARACAHRGADVVLITGKTSLEPPLFTTVVPVTSAEDMYNAVMDQFDDADIVFKAAAVGDFTPAVTHEDKVKKSSAAGETAMNLELKRTKDILASLGSIKKPGQVLCGFSMETRDLLENSRAKLEKKNLDLIIANNLRTEGAGFGTDTNVVTVITKDGHRELPQLSKLAVSNLVIDEAMKFL
ncbi:MAG: bifunctional phosphopantothenoylcysteine decarboxylase/phosphopantothenate--cysteine ligase CoaBC [Bacillota bacterium]|nr:bifunctional phosphopantothenoylcysteine decarboxylase/phosphopantothenate--cysteine ligase CoaBC [Bacillota bacterium]